MTLIEQVYDYNQIEFLQIEISKNSFCLNILNVYCNKGVHIETLKQIHLSANKEYLILGDFNASHSAWGFLTNQSGTLLIEWINDNDSFILNHKHVIRIHQKGKGSAIDISLCSPSIAD